MSTAVASFLRSHNGPANALSSFHPCLAAAVAAAVLAMAAQAQTGSIAVVSAASYARGLVAPDSIAAAFGQGLSSSTASAAGLPLPTSLAGVSVRVKDNAGADRPASLFFVSPGQVNFLVPAQTRPGPATITLVTAAGEIRSAAVTVDNTTPGLFTADSSGKGLAAAFVVKTESDGAQFTTPVSRYDEEAKRIVAEPIRFGSESQVLVATLYGTGLRLRSQLSAVSARVGQTPCEVLFAGSQPSFAGLDQVNVRLPRSLAAAGEVAIELTIEGKMANPVTVYFGVTRLPPRIESVTPDGLEATVLSAQKITITGSDFEDVVRVAFSPASGITVSPVEIFPDHVDARIQLTTNIAAGERQVYLVTPRGNTNRLPFTIRRSLPRIFAIDPPGLQQGQWGDIFIAGENFLGSYARVEITPSAGLTILQTSIIQISDRPPAVMALVAVDSAAATGERSLAVVTQAGRSNTLPFPIRERSGQFTLYSPQASFNPSFGLGDPTLSVQVEYTDPSGAADSGEVKYVFEVVGVFTAYGTQKAKVYPSTPALGGRPKLGLSFTLTNWKRGLIRTHFYRMSLINSLGHPSNVVLGEFFESGPF
jgi:uncharacterized protein (TIGR03437 family)